LPVSCGVEPAAVLMAPLVKSEHVPGESVETLPRPTPITIVAGGPAAVSVTSTSPPADNVIACTSLLPTFTVPVVVSVFEGGVTMVGVKPGPLLPVSQPDSASAMAAAIANLAAQFIALLARSRFRASSDHASRQ